MSISENARSNDNRININVSAQKAENIPAINNDWNNINNNNKIVIKASIMAIIINK